MATIRDVAKQAGVSVATVSHVLNGTRTVLPETRNTVMSAVKNLNYRPNAVARGLTTQTTKTIGVVIADVTVPFFASLFRHMEDQLATLGYNLFVCNTNEKIEREARNLEQLLDQRVDGVLLTATGLPQEIYAQFNAQHIPLVFIERKPPGVLGSFVGTDNQKSAVEVTHYLHGLGHRRIALVSMLPETTAVTQRVSGYRTGLEQCGVPIHEELLVTTTDDREDACRVVKALLTSANPPSALIVGSYMATLGTLKALRELNLRYPDDISLVCFVNSPWSDVIQPALTVVTKPIEGLAENGVRTLLDSLAEIEKARKSYQLLDALPVTEMFLEATLILRESCKPYTAV